MSVNRSFLNNLAVALVIVSFAATPAGAAIYTTDLTIPPDITTSEDPAVAMHNGATLTVSGTGKLTQSGSGGGDVAVRLGLSDGSTDGHLVMTGGEIEMNDASSGGSHQNYGLRMYGTSTATISGGVLDVNELERGNATGFTANDSSEFIMTDGSLLVDEAGNNNLTGFVAADDSTVQISGGIIELTETGGGSLTTFVARDNATVDISGGDWGVSWTSRASHYNGFLANDNALVTIYGSSFNYDLDAFITANAGTITGTLADGSPVDLKFDRSGGGQILLSSPVSVAVPEPSPPSC